MKILGLKLTSSESFMCLVLSHKDFLKCSNINEVYRMCGDESLFLLCKHNKIESIAAHTLNKCLGNDNLPKYWVDSYAVANNRISSYMEELDRVSALLLNHEISLVALKNSGITRGLYPYYGACPMGDIDVLVRRSDFRKAHELLIANGYKMKFRSPLEAENLEMAERHGGAEYSVDLPSGEHLWFELQWRPVAGRWIRPDQEPDAYELMARSVEIEGSSVRMLSPEDNLLQVSLHTAKHSYVRAPGFRLHTDVDRIVRSSDIDWQLFVERIQQLQVKTAVFFSLALAHDLLGTPIPQDVFNALQPTHWKTWLISRWLQKVGLFDPDEKKWGRVGYVVFVSLLYDNWRSLLRGVFPDRKWMFQHYGVNNNLLLLPFLHVHRLFDLLWKRTLAN